jgi:GntR family transcriptional regulator/MocR family aminotransferase
VVEKEPQILYYYSTTLRRNFRMWVPVERNSSLSLVKQIYHQIRNRILSGILRPNEKLPSTRELAGDLHVSRNVVLEAYELLIAEGYLYSLHNSGTYVADGAFLETTPPLPTGTLDTVVPNSASEEDRIDFRSGIPALDLLPRQKWARLCQEVIVNTPPEDLSYGFLEGDRRLRMAIHRHISKTRGVICELDQVLITNGSFQSFFLLARSLLGPGQPYIIEDPLHLKIQALLASTGGISVPVGVDEAGLKTDLLPKDCNPVLIFVTPSHQYPLGGAMPIQRRIELIRYARAKNCLIVEDDYDSEFRYEGAPVSSLQGLDPERVIYVGSFSKILFPGLRLGYMIPPWSQWWKVVRHKSLTDSHPHTLDQLALTRFIEEGWLERHISKMRKTYLRRRNLLIHCLKAAFGDRVVILGGSTGLHLVAAFRGMIFTDDLVAKIWTHGVNVVPVAAHSVTKGENSDKLILGYSHLTPERIEAGVRWLAEALKPEEKYNPEECPGYFGS